MKLFLFCLLTWGLISCSSSPVPTSSEVQEELESAEEVDLTLPHVCDAETSLCGDGVVRDSTTADQWPTTTGSPRGDR